MTAPAPQSHSNGCRISPRGPLVARDLRALVKRMDEIGLSDHADVEIRTPIAGDRRAATITVVDYPAADLESVEPPTDLPADPDEQDTTTEGEIQHG
ncbi:hypothetical protein H7J86_26110 [Mycobacterium hackensackense]|uniref:hypothetical protein n=1 Tax=Mycobacterium hackensackense TaxID=228909 RepID=UPI002265DEDD|nr:hypothetical protein [Mycobacterium hackensackense]MCV7255643.1 hypothetical protein [Mycobacterium hackensackense]